MRYKCADENRDAGIRLLYDAILHKSLKDNIPYRESKEAAYDAVQMRYSLSRKRIKAIANKQAKGDLDSLLPSIRLETRQILEDLKQENEFLREKIARNEKLIEDLDYAIETYRKAR